MAITTYSELQTAVQTWLDRNDLATNATDFITLGESRLNRVLPLRINWVNTTLTGTVGSRSLTLPTDFVEPQSLFLTTFSVQTRLTPFVAGTHELSLTIGTPSAWCINESSIDLDTLCDRAHTFTFRYRKSFNLSDAAPTNWLLTNHPDVYLFSALIEATFFTENQEMTPAIHQRLDMAIGELTLKEARSTAQAVLLTDPAIAAPQAFNINTG